MVDCRTFQLNSDQDCVNEHTSRLVRLSCICKPSVIFQTTSEHLGGKYTAFYVQQKTRVESCDVVNFVGLGGRHGIFILQSEIDW